jgi:hypothetical protein
VPICAGPLLVTAVVLSRRSAPERVRSAAPTAPAAESGSMLCSRGRRPPCLLLLLRPEGHLGGSQLHQDEPCYLTVELPGCPPEELELNVVRIPKREHRVPCIRWFLDDRMGDT